MLVKVLAPGFYAREDMRTPVRIGIIAMAVNMVLNIAFVFPLMWWLNLGHVGLALATSVSAWLNALLLFRGLRRDAVLPRGSLPARWLAQVGAATAAMVSILLWLMPDHAMWAEWLWWQRALQLGILCSAGLGVFAVSLLCCGVRLADLRR
jgi:putative peptidoglycan lipid II flippase